jgi:hypothetical protein
MWTTGSATTTRSRSPCRFDFYDVGLHSVIVGDADRDVAHIPFMVRMLTLDE